MTTARQARAWPLAGVRSGWQVVAPLLAREEPVGYDGACHIEGCDRARYGRQRWCEAHYRRWRRHGDPVGGRRPDGSAPPVCAVDACDKPVDAQGWCHGHHQRWLRHGDVAAHEPLQRRKQLAECIAAGCDRTPHARNLCVVHYQRLLARGDARPDDPIRSAEGSGSLSHGYRKIPVPPEPRHLTNGETPVGEHRLVMGAHLGRPLEPDETVHHRNGVRTDNRLENLELWSTWQPSGQRVIDKVRWAVEILRHYRPELLTEHAPSGQQQRGGASA